MLRVSQVSPQLQSPVFLVTRQSFPSQPERASMRRSLGWDIAKIFMRPVSGASEVCTVSSKNKMGQSTEMAMAGARCRHETCENLPSDFDFLRLLARKCEALSCQIDEVSRELNSLITIDEDAFVTPRTPKHESNECNTGTGIERSMSLLCRSDL